MPLLPLLVFFLNLVVLCVAERSYVENAIQYNPQGELEYLKTALLATEKKGGSIVGAKFSNALLIAAGRRRASSVFELSMQEKVMLFDKGRILVAFSGLIHHKRLIVPTIRKACDNHALVHSSPMPICKLCRILSEPLHSATTDIESSPLGLQMIIAGYDHDEGKFVLYSVHPDGSYQEWKATAIGFNHEKISTTLFTLMQQQPLVPAPIEVMWNDFVQQILLSDLMIDRSKLDEHSNSNNNSLIANEGGNFECSAPYSRQKDFEVYCLAKGAGCMEWRQVPWSDIAADGEGST